MIFPQLPKVLEDHILEFNPEHREKFSRVMNQLLAFTFLSLLKRRVVYAVLEMLELEIEEVLTELEE